MILYDKWGQQVLPPGTPEYDEELRNCPYRVYRLNNGVRQEEFAERTLYIMYLDRTARSDRQLLLAD